MILLNNLGVLEVVYIAPKNIVKNCIYGPLKYQFEEHSLSTTSMRVLLLKHILHPRSCSENVNNYFSGCARI